ncbi:ferritin-like domain-containing protein [Methanomassiliicoccus luminyensis]|uniref:ferritin-like domain-containing protein n=1 Tax=Methanomassiliicoccus luminyensis TaxID=1080712 RepID=UPI00036C2933|nr:ferritin family protein [Methanomassiliicoccus luminyensis]
MAEENCAVDARKGVSALVAAMRIERTGREFYERVAGCVADDRSRILLKGLAEDEEKHRSELQGQIDRLSRSTEWSPAEPAPELMDLVPSTVFPFPPPGACLALKDEVRAMELAIGIEERKTELYRKVASTSQDCQLREAMSSLADRNEKHRRVLEENLFYLKRGGSWYGYEPILDG